MPLAAELFESPNEFKGETWLWEKYIPGLKTALVAKDFPTHKLMDEFAPQCFYYWIETLFADYGKSDKGRGRSSRPTCSASGRLCWPGRRAWAPAGRTSPTGATWASLMRHYVCLDEQQVTDDVFSQMNGDKK